MGNATPQPKPQPKTSSIRRGWILALLITIVFAVVGKPAIRWLRDRYAEYQASTIDLTASDAKYREVLAIVQANQPNNSLGRSPNQDETISERIFQTALSRDLLGRSSFYEPNTNNGKLACARMVNMAIERALGYQIGQNPLYVPSLVADLDSNKGKQIEQMQAVRGDIAIANGTDYTNGQWHIGICMRNGCRLVLSNSPFKSEFAWLTGSDFDGAFAHYPGKTTFYRVTQKNKIGT